jgi:acetyl-CoA acyltransferase 2
MGPTAEVLAREYGVDREASDAYARQSHLKTSAAYEAGLIQPELVAVDAGPRVCDRDEHLRRYVSLADLRGLPPTFSAAAIVTAGSASGIVEGACSLVVAPEAYVARHKLRHLAEVIGVDPRIMGIGAVPAIIALLRRAGLDVAAVDLFEINEAFAPQVIACQPALGIPADKLNIWGGAIVLGPTELKLSLTLARQLGGDKKSFGVALACIGGGQGIALLLKNV